MTNLPLIAENLVVRFGAALALATVSHGFAPGRITALLGPNGAGKSTLLACLAGLRQPDSGVARLGDTAIADLDRLDRGRRIGFLPQSADVHWDIDVATLVGLGRYPHRSGWGETLADRGAIDRALIATDMARLAGRRVETLSGGERGRALLARVLAGEPQWLLTDEPLASLDPAHQLDVMALLRATADAGTGVIIIVHDLGLALRMADDAVLLAAGRIIAAGPVESVMTPALLATAYGVDIVIGRAESGLPYVLPLARGGAGSGGAA